MRWTYKFLVLLFVSMILFTVAASPVRAAESDLQPLTDLFHKVDVTQEELDAVFLSDQQQFINVLAQEKYGTIVSILELLCHGRTAEDTGDQTFLSAAADASKLGGYDQASRRVLWWILEKCNISADFPLFSTEPDYRELFARCDEMDGALPAYYSIELKQAYSQDAFRFLEEMAVEPETRSEYLALFLMDLMYYGAADGESFISTLRDMKDDNQLNNRQLSSISKLLEAADRLVELYGPYHTTTTQLNPAENTTDNSPAVKTQDSLTTMLKPWILPICLVLIIGIILLLITALHKRN